MTTHRHARYQAPTKPSHVRVDQLWRAALTNEMGDLAALVRGVRLDWDDDWAAFRAGRYQGAVPLPDHHRLLAAADAFEKAGHLSLAAQARAIVTQIEAERDRATATRSNLARQNAKPGGAAGRINRMPGRGFADLSTPPEGDQ